MNTANADRWKEIVGQIRLKISVCLMGLTMFGLQLAAAMWKPHDVFYPFPLVVWGFFTLLFLGAAFRYLNQLSFSRNQEEEKTRKAKVHRLMAYILFAAFIWLCFFSCALAAKTFGKLYAVPVVVFGMLMILVAFITDREIKRLAEWFSLPADESLAKVV